jgi:hypothetical protein
MGFLCNVPSQSSHKGFFLLFIKKMPVIGVHLGEALGAMSLNARQFISWRIKLER